MKTIKLPCFNIEVEFEENDYDSGTISSSLKEDDTIEDIVAYEPFNAAMEGIESIILAHALAGS